MFQTFRCSYFCEKYTTAPSIIQLIANCQLHEWEEDKTEKEHKGKMNIDQRQGDSAPQKLPLRLSRSGCKYFPPKGTKTRICMLKCLHVYYYVNIFSETHNRSTKPLKSSFLVLVFYCSGEWKQQEENYQLALTWMRLRVHPSIC